MTLELFSNIVQSEDARYFDVFFGKRGDELDNEVGANAEIAWLSVEGTRT